MTLTLNACSPAETAGRDRRAVRLDGEAGETGWGAPWCQAGRYVDKDTRHRDRQGGLGVQAENDTTGQGDTGDRIRRWDNNKTNHFEASITTEKAEALAIH